MSLTIEEAKEFLENHKDSKNIVISLKDEHIFKILQEAIGTSDWKVECKRDMERFNLHLSK